MSWNLELSTSTQAASAGRAASHKPVAGIRAVAPHLILMIKNQTTQNPKARRTLLLGVTLLSLFALSACAGAGTTDGGKTELQLPGFDSTIGGE